MRKTITTLMAALCMQTVGAQTQVAPFVPGSTLEGVCYYLPQTALRITVTTERTITKPGEFNKYAGRYLRRQDVPEKESVTWAIKDIKMEPYGVPDKNKAYSIAVKSKTVAPLVGLSSDGILLSINTEAQETTLSEPPKGIPAKPLPNPRDYMTQEILDGILEDVRGFTYTPSTTSYRGNPALEIGDVVNVEDRDGNLKRVLIGEHELILTGMKASISSKGSTEVETVIKQSPSEIRLKKAIGVLKESFKESTELITGNKGGHYVIDYDENGQPIGFKIMDTPTLTENTKLWMFNKNGFGFSEDGGKTLKNIAIDMLGNINANVVTTGALVGEHFELNLEEGSLIMGERDSQGNFKDIWLECSDKGFLIGSSSQSVVSCTIESTNGFYIIDSVESTELTARIYVDGEEIDKDGLLSYVWFISTDGGEVFEELARGKTITLETSLLNANTKIYFETED